MAITYRQDMTKLLADLAYQQGLAQGSLQKAQETSAVRARYEAAKQEQDFAQQQQQYQQKLATERMQATMDREQEIAQRQQAVQDAVNQRALQSQENAAMMQQKAQDWEMQKMIMRSAQDFEMELLDRKLKQEQKIKLDAEQRQKHQQALVILSEMKANDGFATEQHYQQAKAKVDLKYLGYEGVLPPYARQDDSAAMMSQLFAPQQEATPAPTYAPQTDPILKQPAGTVLSDVQLQSLAGQFKSISEAQQYMDKYGLKS